MWTTVVGCATGKAKGGVKDRQKEGRKPASDHSNAFCWERETLLSYLLNAPSQLNAHQSDLEGMSELSYTYWTTNAAKDAAPPPEIKVSSPHIACSSPSIHKQLTPLPPPPPWRPCSAEPLTGRGTGACQAARTRCQLGCISVERRRNF